MPPKSLLVVFFAALSVTSSSEQTRWSRQIGSYTSDLSDWVPLTGPYERSEPQASLPIKRQAVAQPRILAEPFPGFARPTGFSQDGFPPRNFNFQNAANRQLYLQSVPSVPSAPQNFLNEQGFGQSLRFGLSQPNFPLSQGFVAPQLNFDYKPQQRLPHSPVSFQKTNHPLSAQAKPFVHQPQQKQTKFDVPKFEGAKFEAPKFVDGYKAENVSKDFSFSQIKPQSLHKMKFDSFEKPRFQEPMNKKLEREEVQLLYVPVDSLNSGKFNFKSPLTQPHSLNNDFYSLSQTLPKTKPQNNFVQQTQNNFAQQPKTNFAQQPQNNFAQQPPNNFAPQPQNNFAQQPQNNFAQQPQNNFAQQSQNNFAQQPQNNFAHQTQNFGPQSNFDFPPKSRPLESFGFGQNYFSEFNRLRDFDQIPKYSTVSPPFPSLPPVTTKPKKLKPHQPPLAVFLAQESRKGEKIKVGDVLSSLKNVQTIAVLDSVNPSSAPKVFIGPSSLTPPDKYVKFELPYLSNIENSQKKLNQLPFFVAPLSYSTPNGFAKIPFPSPHVGSVIVNAQIKEAAEQVSTPVADVIPNSYTAAPPVKSQKPTFTYFSTAAPTNAPSPPRNQYQTDYYSIEPQTVTSLPPKDPVPKATPAPKPGSYYLGNQHQDFQRQKAPTRNQHNSNRNQQPVRGFNIAKPTGAPSTTTKPTRRPSSVAPSTYPSLLETHNPYSINQAFEQGEDYQNINFEDIYSTVGYSSTPTPTKKEEITEKYQPSSPKYVSSSSPNYSPSSTAKPNYEQTSSDVRKPSSPSYQSSADINQQQQQASPQYQQQSTSNPSQQSADYNFQSANYNQQSSPNYNQQSSPNNQQTTLNYNQYYNQPSSPTYLQNYNPEIQYQTEIQSSRFPNYFEYTNSPSTASEKDTEQKLIEQTNQQINSTLKEQQTETYNTELNNQYQNTQGDDSNKVETTTSSTTTTTTRRPIRGRPRYTTPKTDNSEGRTTTTRRPIRERRPLPSRNRYEPNKINTERPTKRPANEESSTKSTRSRTRGKVTYRPTESDDFTSKKGGKEGKEDLAYQRDVLHQNYPVTLMERMSTVDIEAITEPSVKISSTRTLGAPTEVYDTEHAFSHEQAYTQNNNNVYSETKETAAPFYSRTPEVQTETPSYVPKLNPSAPQIDNDDYYSSRSSPQPTESAFAESSQAQEEVTNVKSTNSIQLSDRPELISYATESDNPVTEQSVSYSFNDYASSKQEEGVSLRPELDIAKNDYSQSEIQTTEEPIQTTQNQRVRIRPGIRTRPDVSSQGDNPTTQSSKPKVEIRRRPGSAVTYRPAFDKRRTTMRIDEIEADLKTKQVRARPEIQERHPVYRPEPTSESATTVASEGSTRRSTFRRRRPTYTTTSTESSSSPTKKTYETKSRFRGRRPSERTTERTTEKEIQESTTTSSRTIPYSRYTRPRLSERFNKKPVKNDDDDDQDTENSFNIAKYVTPEDEDKWSTNIETESFRPYNPNNIQDDEKVATTERKDETDIITAKNDYENVLISVTPASNKLNKNVPEISPTLEALVEQSKSANGESLSTFESMLEQVMKSLEEQDEDEYTSNVLKRKGGEIGEIPPENGPEGEEGKTTVEAAATTEAGLSSENKEESQKPRRRGFWKKVNKRPLATDNIETAESQYYTNTVNHLGEPVVEQKTKVTTYKPSFDYIKDLFLEEQLAMTDEVKPDQDITKLQNTTKTLNTTTPKYEDKTTEANQEYHTEATTLTDGTTTEGKLTTIDRSDSFSFMDYLFGVTSSDSDNDKELSETIPKITTTEVVKEIKTTTESYVPEELTTISDTDNYESQKISTKTNDDFTKKTESQEDNDYLIKTLYKEANEAPTTQSSYMDPAMVMSTSMSTEISHETEICFRGKCIKTNKDLIY